MSEETGSGSHPDEFLTAMEGLPAAGGIVWRKKVRGCTQVGVYFQSPEGQKGNLGLNLKPGKSVFQEGRRKDAMKRSVPVLVSTICLLVCLVPPARAGVGQADETNIYSNVGAMLIRVNATNQLFVQCSGVLIAPTVFLTAAHCIAGLELFFPAVIGIEVTFQPNALNPLPPATIAATNFFRDPKFGHDLGDLHDLAVLILPQSSTAGITPAALPDLGQLDEMARQGRLRGVNFEHAGYGVVPAWKGAPPRFSFDGWRRYTTLPYLALTQNWLKLLMNVDATDQGGVCYGDSGSPHFLPGTNTVVALVTGGDAVCRALNRNYRLDTLSAQEFFEQVEDLFGVILL